VQSNNKKIVCAFLVLAFVVPVSQARIYKWVDENGVTHYSQKKPAAKSAKTLKLRKQPTSVKTPEEMHREKEAIRRQKVDQENATVKAEAKPKKKRPKSVTGGITDGSDASNCALARDILNGSLEHNNGEPVDDYDIRLAKRDVERFCH